MRISFLIVMGCVIVAHLSIEAIEAKPRSVEARLTYLEQVLENHTRLLEQTLQTNTLQDEIRQLRGMLEVQENEIKTLRQQNQLLEQRFNQKHSMTPPAGMIRIEPKPSETKSALIESNNPNALSIMKAPVEGETIAVGTEKGDYHAAYQLLQNKQYIDAIVAFENFVNTYPDSQLIANAYYWLGETYFTQWQDEQNNGVLLEKAEYAFCELTEKFPQDLKTPDGLLKLGMIAVQRHQKEIARQRFIDLKTRFPTTSAARLAEVHLNKLSQEGTGASN